MDVSKEEQIGVHKGAISVLLAEKQEFAKLTGIVDQLIQAHAKALQELGVDLKAEFEKHQKAAQKPATKKKAGAGLREKL